MWKRCKEIENLNYNTIKKETNREIEKKHEINAQEYRPPHTIIIIIIIIIKPSVNYWAVERSRREVAGTLDTSIQESLTAATIATDFHVNFTKCETKID